MFSYKAAQPCYTKSGMDIIMKQITDIKKRIEDTCGSFGVEMLFAFGSRSKEIYDLVEGARSLNKEAFSDVDIGVKTRFSTSLTVKEKVHLGIELEDILGVKRIDLCIIEEVDPFVAANIIRGERLYCDDPYRADEFELYILRRAGDLAFIERERINLIFGESRGV